MFDSKTYDNKKLEEAAKLYNPRSEVYNIYNMSLYMRINLQRMISYLDRVGVRKPDMEGFLKYLSQNYFDSYKDIKHAHIRFAVKREHFMNKKWYKKRCKGMLDFVC